jgi:hypothetical protein
LEKVEADVALKKTYVLNVRVVDYQNKPLENVNVKVFKLEKNPITIKQWAENLKNGSPIKRLMLSTNSDNEGKVSAELAEGSYEVNVEKFGFSKACELTHDDSVIFVEPKKHWWQ